MINFEFDDSGFKKVQKKWKKLKKKLMVGLIC